MTDDERRVMETEAREFAFFEARLAEYKAKQEQDENK